MSSLKERLQEILIRDNIIKQEDLDRALEEQKKHGGELSKILVKLKLISEEGLTHVLSKGLGLPPIDISRLKIDPEVVKLIPQDMAVNYQIFPISKMGDRLTLAMADPLNIFAIDNVEVLTGLKITPIISRSSQIQQAIEKYYSRDTHEAFEKIIKDIKDSEDLELIKDSVSELDQHIGGELTDEEPMIKLTDTIIRQAVVSKASDVFVEPMEKTLRIRYRIDGIIREIDQMPKALHLPIVSRIKVISNLDISEHRLPQDGRFKMIVQGEREVDFRVNVLPTSYGEKVVLRVLDKSAGMLDLEKLGFEPDQLVRLKECGERPHGMILACGPTGSGKTTTLYSILKYVDSPALNIVTVEDPVEYQIKGLNQVNVKPSVGLTFAASLRSILRQDPDIIMIGEIRDFETLDIAVKSALTGHLVLSSLHTTTSAGSVIRMINMGIEPYLICSAVLGIVGQRLVRRICTSCRESYAVPPELAQRVGLSRITADKSPKLYRGKGCKSCLNTGYTGRVVISEVLILSPQVKERILQGADEIKIKSTGRKDGMKTMREDGLIKALAGATSLEEVLRVTAPDEEMEGGSHG
ncbi:MAG: ATPase, T2SS/T4P/T4SS family [Candidatus Omnitrophota bacterium]|nr:ATPase, T2SS/T4P/T4SS family [Candidatus Omnitrophota bacterium]